MTTLSSNLAQEFESIRRQALQNAWPVYQLFGLKMSSDYPFGSRLTQAQGEMELVFTCQETAPIAMAWNELEPVYTSIYRTKNNEPAWFLYQIEEYYVVHYTDSIDFYICRQTIIGHILNLELKDAYTMGILPTVLALWLEFQGIPCLHASAVVVNDHAIAFLADSGQGKSTLTTAFLQAGFPLLTDDKLPLDEKDGGIWARSGTPLIRFFPEVAEMLVDDHQELDLILPGFSKRIAHIEHDAQGHFCPVPMPLACIYILERNGMEDAKQKITFHLLPQREAVMELIRYDFTTRINAVLGFSVARLGFYSKMAASIPVKRLSYPTGYDCLPEVRNAILKDLDGLT
ncbi:MAG: hypothetical protein CVU44_14630 [Chloroflexi bacterium HGW-Chloroflexi-6]|nr:MAG: hypothetical protein CVU44_14630 [Chloroflexi bacterium HGW-Chloroflexi-6]